MDLRFDGYYRSGLNRTEDWHAGQRFVTEYFRYLKFFEKGTVLLKRHPDARLDFPAYLNTVTEQEFRDALIGRNPVNDNGDSLYQAGQCTFSGRKLELVFRKVMPTTGEDYVHEIRVVFVIESPLRLVAADGMLHRFYPFVAGNPDAR